jgi:hypothetical protein
MQQARKLSHKRLSAGGQKVKVVLAAATWMNPHMLVLDEPSNYLDRESLGALAEAIKEFGGGVVMISHNSGEPKQIKWHCEAVPPSIFCSINFCGIWPGIFDIPTCSSRFLVISDCYVYDLDECAEIACAGVCRIHQRALPGEVVHGGRQAAGDWPV